MLRERNKKVAFFVEGKTELSFLAIFLIPLIYDRKDISIECFPSKTSYNCNKYNYQNKSCSIKFIIKDAGGDNAVVSEIKKINKSGYYKIFGLRDAMLEQYEIIWKRKYPQKPVDKVDIQIIKQIHSNLNQNLKLNAVKIHFAIMEIEAWLLAFYKVYTEIDPKLTVEYIKKQIGCNLEDVDPQNEFVRPCQKLESIKRLKYKKGFPEKILKHVDIKAIKFLKKQGKISNFFELYDDLHQLFNINK